MARRRCLSLAVPLFSVLLVAAAHAQSELWSYQYHYRPVCYDEGRSVAMSPEGDIVVAATSDSSDGLPDIVVIKLSPDKQLRWRQRYDAGPAVVAEPFDVEVDGDGNVFVAGRTAAGPNDDFLVLKYDEDGAYQWRYQPHNGWFESARDVVPDGRGGCFATGYAANGSSTDWLTVHLDAAGVQTWPGPAKYNGSGNGADLAQALALDAEGNLYVAGYSFSSGQDSFDYLTVRYDTAAGTAVWSKLYDGSAEKNYDPKDDRAYGIALDDDGNVYVTGRAGEEGASYDAVTIKYSPAGDELWVNRLGLAPSGIQVEDGAAEIAVGGNGDVFCGGYAMDYFGESDQDMLVFRIKPDGDTAWSRVYYFPNADVDSVSGLSIDANSNVYAAVSSINGDDFSFDWQLLKYSANGILMWNPPLKHGSADDDMVTDIVVDRLGNVYATGFDNTASNGQFCTTIKVTEEDVGAGRIILPDSLRVGASVAPEVWVHNYSGLTLDFPVKLEIGSVYTDIQFVNDLVPYESTLVEFEAWPVRDAGAIPITCFTQLGLPTPDKDPANDTSRSSVVGVPVWQQLNSMPVLVSKTKEVKDGGALAFASDSLVFGLKGNNTTEFYCYNVRTGQWATEDSFPREASDGSKKRVKKGACLEHGFGRRLYALKGGNTAQFWRYHLDGDTGWVQMAQDYPPGDRGRRVKGGTGLVYVPGKNRLYSCKGANTNEFYAFDFGSNQWLAMESVPGGEKGKRCKDGTVLAYDGANTIYLVKGNGYEFFSYDVDANRWQDRKDLRNSRWSSKNRKMKKGAGAAYDTLFDKLYVTKGGKLSEFWCFDPARDTWVETDDTVPKAPGIPAPYAGSCLEYGNGKVYFLRGNKSLEFWRFNANLPLAPGGLFSVQTAGLAPTARFVPEVTVWPNPFSERALVRYTLPRAAAVRLELFDATGRCVRQLLSGNQPAGEYRVSFADERLANGVYLLRLAADAAGSRAEVTSKVLLTH